MFKDRIFYVIHEPQLLESGESFAAKVQIC